MTARKKRMWPRVRARRAVGKWVLMWVLMVRFLIRDEAVVGTVQCVMGPVLHSRKPKKRIFLAELQTVVSIVCKG